jgi:hypothetical protein
MTPSLPSAIWTASPRTVRHLRDLREWAGDIGPIIKRTIEEPEEVPTEEPVVIPDPVREPEKEPVPA